MVLPVLCALSRRPAFPTVEELGLLGPQCPQLCATPERLEPCAAVSVSKFGRASGGRTVAIDDNIKGVGVPAAPR